MGKQKKLKAEPDSVEKTTELTEVSLGIYKGEGGIYYLAEVVYDPITGEAALQDLHSVGASKLEASERFKIEAVKKGFV